MAVYTKITRDDLCAFLDQYQDLGTLQSFEGIQQGVENTNYHVITDKDRYILTIFEKRVNPVDLPFFMAFTDHLSRHGISCPVPVLDAEAGVVNFIAERPAVLITFLQGATTPDDAITPDQCRQLGETVAHMHLAAGVFKQERKNTMGLAAWKDLADKTLDRADEILPGLGALIKSELDFQSAQDFGALPKGVIYADLFPDNVFFKDGQLSGVIDFYFSCTGYFAYDLALIINAWCFNEEGRIEARRLKALLDGYKKVRPLSQSETESLSRFCRAAALRILMTRLHDWLFHDPESFVKPKDPREYAARLYYHQQMAISFS